MSENPNIFVSVVRNWLPPTLKHLFTRWQWRKLTYWTRRKTSDVSSVLTQSRRVLSLMNYYLESKRKGRRQNKKTLRVGSRYLSGELMEDSRSDIESEVKDSFVFDSLNDVLHIQVLPWDLDHWVVTGHSDSFPSGDHLLLLHVYCLLSDQRRKLVIPPYA